MGLFDRFSNNNDLYKKKAFALKEPNKSPIIGEASTYKTLATFDLKVDAPRFEGDIPKATITSFENFN